MGEEGRYGCTVMFSVLSDEFQEYLSWSHTFGWTWKPKELTTYGKAWTVRRVIRETYWDKVKEVLKTDWAAKPSSWWYLEFYQKALMKVIEQQLEEELKQAEVKAHDWNTGMYPA